MILSILLGAAIPLVINLVTFLIIRTIINKSPQKALSANISVFVIRLILYAAALIIIISLLDVKFAAFVFSFCLVFMFLQIGEALYFQRFFSSTKPDKTQ